MGFLTHFAINSDIILPSMYSKMHLITEFQRMKDDIHILLSFSASRESRHYFPAIIFPPKHIMGGGGG